MWNRKKNQILDLKARLEVAQRPREGGLSADDAAALRTELRTTRMRLTHAKEQIAQQQRQVDQLIKRLGEYADRAIANGERADAAKAKLAAIREIVLRLAAHAVGFQDVLDGTDVGPWGKTIGADLTELQAALDEPQPAGEVAS